MNRDSIVKYCEEYLKVDDFQDYCHNGLQVEGADEITKIVVGVTLSERLIKKAIERDAQMIIVHHGLFMDQIPSPPQIKGYIKERVRLLLANNINLMGFHLPLDAHPEIGNNNSLCKVLNMIDINPLRVGFEGRLKAKMNIQDFVAKLNNELKTESKTLLYGSVEVEKIAVMSGGSSSYLEMAKNVGADTFLCGELKEVAVRVAEELKINVIDAGHYNTEKMGIKNLGEVLKNRFGIEVMYIDVPCEI